VEFSYGKANGDRRNLSTVELVDHTYNGASRGPSTVAELLVKYTATTIMTGLFLLQHTHLFELILSPEITGCDILCPIRSC